MHSPEGVTSLAPLLNYLTDIDLELKIELAKIRAEVKKLKSVSNNASVFSQRDQT